MGTIRDTYLERLYGEFKMMNDYLLHQLDLVNEQLQGASADELLSIVNENECAIDQMEVTLRDDIVNSIVLQSPRASDLRRIVAYYDAIVDVERTADILNSISKRMHYLQKQDSLFALYKEDMERLFQRANKMMRDAVAAFFSEDHERAYHVIGSDDDLDALYHTCHKRLFLFPCNEAQHPHAIADLLDIARIYYGFERIGDCATNIAEAIIFLTQGIDIKHQKE